jgi:3-hydroxybutyrate dehydrogenase
MIAHRRSHSKPLAGRSAIVTGAMNASGLRIARALIDAGADIMLNDFGSSSAIDRICADLEQASSAAVLYNAADVRRPDQAKRLFLQTVALFGWVDILVNNSSEPETMIADPSKEDLARMIHTNFEAAFRMTRASFALMKRRRWGRIINIPPIHREVICADGAGHRAARVALFGLTRVTALAGLDHGVTCNVIRPACYDRRPRHDASRCPGKIDAPRSRAHLRSATPEIDIGDTVIALCVGHSRSISGSEVPARAERKVSPLFARAGRQDAASK